jgi:hypothetical protein
MTDITHAQMPGPVARSSVQAIALNAGSVLHHAYYFVSAIVAGLLVYAVLMAVNGHARTPDGRLDFGFSAQQMRKPARAQIPAGTQTARLPGEARQLP